MAEKIKVFLSYRRADTQHVAGRAGDRLSELYELFMDIDTIPPGVDFTDYVRRAVGSCDVLLAFIGDRWTSLTDDQGSRRLDDPTDWVVEEIRVALGRGVRVIPVLVEGAAMPTASELPESLRPLVNRQALLLRHNTFSADFARLVAGIQHAGAEIRAARESIAAAVTVAAARPADHYADRWEAAAAPVPPGPDVPRRIPTHSPRRRWLITVPIMAAAVIVGVLLVVLHPFRSPTAAPSAAGGLTPAVATVAPTRPPAQPARTLGQLRAHVPASFRSTCDTLEPRAAPLRASLVIATQCAPAQSVSRGAPVYSFYFQYATPESATAAFRAYYNPGDLSEGDCTSQPAELTYARDGLTGTLRCYEDADGYRVFAWTCDELGILSSVADQTLSYAELSRWWRQAGPLR